MPKRKKAEIPARFKDQEESHRLHRTEQSQYPDEGQMGNLNEAGQSSGERNPREVSGEEGGGKEERPARVPESVKK